MNTAIHAPQAPGHAAGQRAFGTTQRKRCPAAAGQLPGASEVPAGALRARLTAREADK